MGIPRALVPNHPGQFSAYGFIMTDARVDRHRTTAAHLAALRSARAPTEVMRDLVDEGVGRAGGAGLHRGHRGHPRARDALSRPELRAELPIALRALRRRDDDRLWQAFHEAHQARFGFNIPGRSSRSSTSGHRGLPHAQARAAGARARRGPPSAGARGAGRLRRTAPRRAGLFPRRACSPATRSTAPRWSRRPPR